jgi:hypothetical protein
MLPSELAPAVGYPHVRGFLVGVLDRQFPDIRVMLNCRVWTLVSRTERTTHLSRTFAMC